MKQNVLLKKKIKKDNKEALSYTEKQGLGMFAELHIAQIYPQWQEWDENKKTETLRALPVQELAKTLQKVDVNNEQILFVMPNGVCFELLEKMAKSDVVFETLELMQMKNKDGENILDLSSYDRRYGPKIGKLFDELKQKASKYETIHTVQAKRKKTQTEELIKKTRKNQKSY